MKSHNDTHTMRYRRTWQSSYITADSPFVIVCRPSTVHRRLPLPQCFRQAPCDTSTAVSGTYITVTCSASRVPAICQRWGRLPTNWTFRWRGRRCRLGADASLSCGVAWYSVGNRWGWYSARSYGWCRRRRWPVNNLFQVRGWRPARC